MVFLPYIVLSLLMFFSTLHQRRYSFRDLIQGMVLNVISFPVYMKASLLGILGFRGTFGITPKNQSRALPLFRLWPQILIALLSFAAVVVGCHRLYYEREPLFAILVNTFWAFYHFLLMSSVLYFNHPEEKS